jgi:hypothetical protein
LLVLSVAAGCSREDSKGSIIERADSTKLLSRDKGLEKAIWDYYLSIEQDVRTDFGVSEAEIVERVQSMINDGFIKKPMILMITKDGPRWQQWTIIRIRNIWQATLLYQEDIMEHSRIYWIVCSWIQSDLTFLRR